MIPQLRGKFRSRRFESVVREAENLAAAGVREISLIGQDTTYYGEDLGIRDGLPTLLERLAQIEDLHWIRFLYCYPNRITVKAARHDCGAIRASRNISIFRCSTPAAASSRE